jgi:hypothetical protein
MLEFHLKIRGAYSWQQAIPRLRDPLRQIGARLRETARLRRTREILHLTRGEVIEVKSLEEIRATLDSEGCLDRLPFMEEMHAYCGRRFRVRLRADKICFDGGNLRRMLNAVFLEDVCCDGHFHGGCATTCSLVWKEAWLRRSDGPAEEAAPIPTWTTSAAPSEDSCSGRFSCQATALLEASRLLPWWDARQYVRDLYYGQLSLGKMARLVFLGLRKRLAGGPVEPRLRGADGTTPSESLGLEPGEWVEFKPADEIRRTLNERGENRGLYFSPELVRYCGGRYRVLKRVPRFIHEPTGTMRAMSNTVLLAGVVCDGAYHRGCPRANYFMCREVWLRRVSPPPIGNAPQGNSGQ